MNNIDAIKSLHKKHHIKTGLTIIGNCEKDLLGVSLSNGDSLAFTFEDVLAKKKELEDEYEKQAYARSRAKSYDPIPEQLDQIYHDIDAWKDKIKAVKDKYPKP